MSVQAIDLIELHYEPARSDELVASLPRVRSVGFTGTSEPISLVQLQIVHHLLRAFRDAATGERVAFHHGDCVSSDEHVAKTGREVGLWVIGHPPRNPAKRAWVPCDELRPVDDYLVRNGHIVAESDVLIATPQQNREELRSGTWATIRRARKAGIPVVVVGPGRVWLEQPEQAGMF